MRGRAVAFEGNVSLLEGKSEEMHIPDIAYSLCDLRQASRLMKLTKLIGRALQYS